METLNFKVKSHEVKLALELTPNSRYYLISAVVDDGFDLCDFHNGYLKHKQPCNTKLKSTNFIHEEKRNILNSYKETIIEHWNKYIITEKTVISHVCNDSILIDGMFISLSNVKSNTSKRGISWHYHDVYNNYTGIKRSDRKLKVTIIRDSDGYLNYYANESKLYDFDKLNKLSNSKEFKEQNYSFFFYNEVKRLLGIEFKGEIKVMSGLFK